MKDLGDLQRERTRDITVRQPTRSTSPRSDIGGLA